LAAARGTMTLTGFAAVGFGDCSSRTAAATRLRANTLASCSTALASAVSTRGRSTSYAPVGTVRVLPQTVSPHVDAAGVGIGKCSHGSMGFRRLALLCFLLHPAARGRRPRGRWLQIIPIMGVPGLPSLCAGSSTRRQSVSHRRIGRRWCSGEAVSRWKLPGPLVGRADAPSCSPMMLFAMNRN
jgi:hypothetical protein